MDGDKMATFASNVFRAFDSLRVEHRFVAAWAATGERFASLVRRETEDVFVYIFVRDGRPGDANVDVDLWIAPPDAPDDRLDRLYVGYKIRIGSEFDIDDVFFECCQKRIIHLLPFIAPLGSAVREEFGNPAFCTKRWTIYQIERRALARMSSRASNGDVASATAMDAASLLARRKGSLGTLETLCLPIAVSLIEQGDLDDNTRRFYEGNARFLASTLASHLYAEALGNMSASRVH